MIFRKPYAFFIKYFRVMNLIMAVLMAALIYHTFIIGNFFTSYIDDYLKAVNNFSLGNYINIYDFLLIIIIIILTIVVISVLFVKNKPKKLYLFNLLVYIVLFVLYIVDYNVMYSIRDNILDIRVSKAVRDVTYIVLGLQIVSFIITLVRATGFDLKQFDFKRDLQELDIDAGDNEEFEVAVEVDRNNIRRNFRSGIRNFRYFYIENRFIIKLLVLIFLLVIMFMLVFHQFLYTASYSEGKTFNASGFGFNVKESYITNTDADGNVISNSSLVVVKLAIRKNSELNKKLNTGTITLKVKNKCYGQTTKYSSYLTDMGTPYIDDELSFDFNNYLLVYAIPNELINSSMSLKINDNISYVRGEVGAKNIYVKLKPVNLNRSKTTVKKKIGNSIDFSGSILGNSSLKIESFEIANKYKLEYNFCSKKDRCFKSYEYVTPTATGERVKTLIKIKGDFEFDETTNLPNIYNIYDLLNTYGTISYDDSEHKINSQVVVPKRVNEDDIYYIEVDRSVLNAQHVSLIIKVRNYSYEYTLK